MGQEYLEDLVQNIYTKCDMSGFEDLKRGYQSMSKSEHQTQKQRLSLLEQEQKSRIRLHDYEERFAQKKARRDADEISRMRHKNVLWRSAIRLIGAYFSIRTLQNIIQTGAKLQLLQRSIEGLTGSGQNWEFINQQAYKYGVSLDTVAKGYKNFYSSANMAGFSSGQIQGMFSDVLLGARAIGASTPQIEGALLALEQMMSKGRVSMEELRRQLGNALPGAFEIGAKAMGVTTQAFNDMVKEGISAQEFVPKFIATFKEQYAKGWTDVEQTVAVAQGRLQVAWQQFTMEFLHGETGKALARGITQLAELMRSPEFLQFIRLLGKVFTLIVNILRFAIKHIGIVIILLGAGGLAGAITKNIALLQMLGRILKVVFAGHAIKGINLLTKALFGLSAPMLILYAKILGIIAALLLFEDIYTGLFHKEKESYTKDFIEGVKRPSEDRIVKGDTSGLWDLERRIKYGATYNVTPQTIQAQKNFKARMGGYTEMYATGHRPLEFRIPTKPQIIPNSGSNTGGAAGIQLDKEENNDYTITMGDIIFNISGAGNPQAVAEAVNIELSNLLIGQMGGVTE